MARGGSLLAYALTRMALALPMLLILLTAVFIVEARGFTIVSIAALTWLTVSLIHLVAAISCILIALAVWFLPIALRALIIAPVVIPLAVLIGHHASV